MSHHTLPSVICLVSSIHSGQHPAVVCKPYPVVSPARYTNHAHMFWQSSRKMEKQFISGMYLPISDLKMTIKVNVIVN